MSFEKNRRRCEYRSQPVANDREQEVLEFEMNYPAASGGVSKAHHANASHSVTPEFFGPGSRSRLAWIAA